MATNLLTTSAAATGAIALAGNAISSLSNLIVATPQTTVGYQPDNHLGIGGQLASAFGLSNLLKQAPKSLLFHYEGEQSLTITCDITDHYIEDNTAIQDQVAIKPIMITTHGFIGELNDVPPPALAILQEVAQKLSVLNAYSPGLSVSAINAYNTAFQAYQAANNLVNSAVSAVGSIGSLVGAGGVVGQSVIGDDGFTQGTGLNLQQSMFMLLYGYLTTRTFFTVQTPWAVFQQMILSNLRAVQDAETRMITDFELTFKQIRTASTILGLPSVVSSVLGAQQATGTQTASTPAFSLGVPTSFK